MAAAVRDPVAESSIARRRRPWQVDGDVGDHVARAGREDDHPVGQEDGLGHRVGDQQDRRRGLGPDAQQLEAEALPGQGVERAERLVEEEDRRSQRERPRDGHPLAHAAGQLVRTRAGELGHAHELQQLSRARLARRPWRGGQLEREGDIGSGVAPGEQARLLEDEAHACVRPR